MKNQTQILTIQFASANFLKHLFGAVAILASVGLTGCATIQEELKAFGNARKPDPFERSNTLFIEGQYEAALQENQRVIEGGNGAPDVALFNMGVISAYSLNPKKDYPRALGSFNTLVKHYPQSALVEQAKVWIHVLEEHQKISEEKQKLVEEKRSLIREKETLSQEREKLKYTVERSRQVDIEIERRRRKTLIK